MKTIGQVLSEAAKILEEAGIESYAADARLLAQSALGLSRERLLLDSKEMISDSQEKLLKSYIKRRREREPVSRILERREFWRSDFKISRETLDPRPDSETVIESVLRHAPPGTEAILDLGTGSGCLLLSLLQELPGTHGFGVDISAGAVKIAQENAASLGLSARAEFIASDWNDAEFRQKFDIIVSNPPYIAEHEMAGLEPEVALFDPPGALIGGADGLACYRSIISLLPDILNSKGRVFFEIGHTQAQDVKDLLEQAGYIVLEVAPDLAGNDRCIAATAAA